MANKANYISRVRENAIQLIEALEAFDALYAEYNALGYSSGLQNSDFTGENADLTAAQFIDALGNIETYRATFFSSFYATNVFKLRR